MDRICKVKVWKATTTGSVMVFVLLSFFTVYREGFETVLFYQAMLSYAKHMELFVILGLITGLAVIIGVAVIVRKLGKKLPLRVLFGLTIGVGAYMSITFLGNAIREFQEVGYITTTHLFGMIPRLDVNLATMTWYTSYSRNYYCSTNSVIRISCRFNIYSCYSATKKETNPVLSQVYV